MTFMHIDIHIYQLIATYTRDYAHLHVYLFIAHLHTSVCTSIPAHRKPIHRHQNIPAYDTLYPSVCTDIRIYLLIANLYSSIFTDLHK